MKYKDDSKLCVIIIPEFKKVKRLVIPKWVPKFFVGSAVVVIFFLTFYNNRITVFTNSLQNESINQAQIICELEREIQGLKNAGENKDRKILALEARTMSVQDQVHEVDNILKDVERLQKELEKKAGIVTASRSNSISRKADLRNLESEESLETLKKMLEEKENELESFIIEIDNRFKYLESVPDAWPTYGRLTSRYGNRRDPFGRGIRFHKGIDIANSCGTSIKAAGSGVVTFSSTKSGYGRTVIIKHNSEYETLYAHNSQNLVKVGDRVEKGQVIAKMGATGRTTGCHLHFEIHKNGKTINPLSVLK